MIAKLRTLVATLTALVAIALPRAALADAPKQALSCLEHIPNGATRPKLEEKFPEKTTVGYATPLEVTIVHGKGETVLPDGFRPGAGDAAKALSDAGFAIADPDGGAGPRVSTTMGKDDATTKLIVEFVPLPMAGGKFQMRLPPVPIAIQRANGEILTVCTAPHVVAVDDPIAGEEDPKVRPNPAPLPQREEWTLAKLVTLGVLIGVLVGALLGFMLRKMAKKATAKREDAAPKRLPWLVAKEELDAIAASKLASEGKTDVHFDRVSDCIRKYLGARYGFDGLETTTDEMRGFLRRVRPAVPDLNAIASFLADCDLVKFAKVAPGEEECRSILARAEKIVAMTIPTQHAEPRPVEAAS